MYILLLEPSQSPTWLLLLQLSPLMLPVLPPPNWDKPCSFATHKILILTSADKIHQQTCKKNVEDTDEDKDGEDSSKKKMMANVELFDSVSPSWLLPKKSRLSQNAPISLFDKSASFWLGWKIPVIVVVVVVDFYYNDMPEDFDVITC